MPRRLHLVLADPSHRMPHPFNPAMLFPADGLEVDAENPVWMQLLADGSLVEAKDDDARAAKPKETK